jgi:hypothetical protein|tara:strand:- start:1355 stop:2335 length:981 start_codon:yes stop_codon:yes gene_type:complete
MDDYNLTSLIESKNEWSVRLVNVLTPCIIEGINSIFQEANRLCEENDESEKYLMTFQNLLNNIPKWSDEIVNNEKSRILENTHCIYLEDLITCVHILQLKALTCARVGTKQKKIDINIPSVNQFIHKLYINVARKIYTNVYLFEKNIQPLSIQKNNRELEIIIKECILNTIRDSIPVENILRAYLDESYETNVQIEEKQELVPDKELIKKDEEDLKKKELNRIREEVKNEIENKERNKLNNIIENVNKSLNIEEKEEEIEEKIKSKDTIKLNYIDSSQLNIHTDSLDNNISLDIESLDNISKDRDIYSDNNRLDDVELDLEIEELQ